MQIKKIVNFLIILILANNLNGQEKWNQFRADSRNSASIKSEQEVSLPPKIEWSTFLGSEIISSPILTDSLVIISSDNSTVHFLNRMSGKEMWNFKTSGSIWSTPIVVDNTLYLTSLDGHLYIIDIIERQLIKKIWLSEYDEKTYPILTYIKSGLKADDNQIYVFAESHLLAITRKTNKINWKTKIRFGDTWSTPCLDSKYLYHIGDFELYVINKLNGEITFKTKIGNENFSSPSIEKNNLVFNSRNGDFYKFNLKKKSFETLIRTKTETLSSTSLFNGNAYYGNSNGEIYRIEIASGKLVWNINVKEAITASSLIVNSTIIFPTEKGHLFAINKNTGKLLWKLKLKSGIRSSPAYDNGTIYVADKLGYVSALK